MNDSRAWITERGPTLGETSGLGGGPHNREKKETTVKEQTIKNKVDKETTLELLHNGILLSRKKGIPTFCNSMDGTGDYYAK